jgi:hypothetical protein
MNKRPDELNLFFFFRRGVRTYANFGCVLLCKYNKRRRGQWEEVGGVQLLIARCEMVSHRIAVGRT